MNHAETMAETLKTMRLRNRRTPLVRPKLTAEGVIDYLDWLMGQMDDMSPDMVRNHMLAAELVIRTGANEAQAKATQHTLVEDGTIKAPRAGFSAQI